MKLKNLVVGTAVALLLVAALPAAAQTTGRIDGRVADESGSALPGVTITLNSAAMQGERLAVTDADGRFRFLALAPGSYDLRAQLEGFGIVEQPDIRVQVDRTVTLQLTLSSAFGDEVTVSGVAPIVDTTSTTSGANFDQKLFEDLPTSRTFTGLAFAAPGAVDGGISGNPSFGGASSAENRYIIDGLDTTDPAFGTVAVSVPQEFVREVEVKTGGYEAEYGGALGGVVNVITKSGGNDLEGDAFAYYSDDSLQGESPPVPQVGQDLGYEEYDFGAAIGGKLIEDRLWYFVAANPTSRDEFLRTRGGHEDTESLERLYYAGKLTYQVNPNHQIVASLFGDPTTDNRVTDNSYGSVGVDREYGSTNLGLAYNGTIGASFFAEASVARYDEPFSVHSPTEAPWYVTATSNPYVRDLVDAQGCGSTDPFYPYSGSYNWNLGCAGGTSVQDPQDRSRDELRASLTWFAETGSVDHEIKIGAIARNVEYNDNARYPGPYNQPFYDSNGDLVDPTGLRGQRWVLFGAYASLRVYDQNSPGETDEQAVFFQDALRIGDYFTLNLGLRADAFNATGVASGVVANSELDFGFSDQLAPRIGFTWDVAKNGRSKLYGHYGKFYESVPLDINTRAFGNEIFNYYYFYYPEDGSLPTAENPGTYYTGFGFGLGTAVDPDIKPMYTEETLIGFEYEVAPNLALGLRATQRSIEDVIEDISADGGANYFITNPSGEFTMNPVTGEPLPESVFFPEPVRDYESLELTLNKRFSNNWQLYASAVYSKNEGNYGGLYRQETGQLDPNITSLYDLPGLLEGAFGLLPNDRQYQFKAYGSYVWPIQLTTGFYFQYLDGTPISKLGWHTSYGADERFVTQRGTAGRTADVWNLDLHLQYPIHFGSGLDLKLIADVFNVTDQAEATLVDQEWTTAREQQGLLNDCGGPGTGVGTSCPAGNPLWGTPTQYQSPRTIRLGAKLSF